MPKPTTSSPFATFAIVDDHRAVADIMGYALQTKLPVKCIAQYYTILEARIQLPSAQPKVVITDWRVENETSASLIKDLKPKLPNTCWLLFTAWPTSSVLREAISAGVQGCVSKSADYEELAKAIEELLNKGSYFCKESMKALGKGMRDAGQTPILNEMEKAILRCIVQGQEPKEISGNVGLSSKTVHNYLVIIRQKTQVGSMVDLAKFAVDQGIAPAR